MYSVYMHLKLFFLCFYFDLSDLILSVQSRPNISEVKLYQCKFCVEEKKKMKETCTTGTSYGSRLKKAHRLCITYRMQCASIRHTPRNRTVYET